MSNKGHLTGVEDSNLLYLEEFGGIETGQEHPPSPVEKQDYRLIGGYAPRIDGRRIVTGSAPYTHDVKLRGLLCGKILRSPHACADIVSVDLTKARNLPGVKAVLQLKEGRIKYAGEQVAAVAAEDEHTAEEALKRIQVEYKPRPFVVSVEKAVVEDAPQVHDSPNIDSRSYDYERGDVEKGFEEADVVIERTYKTAVEVHNPTETHGSMAKWEGDRLFIWDSTQAIFGVRDGLARALNIPASRITIIKKYMGGGFGSKLGLNDYTVAAALLAREAKRPVKILLSRRDNNLCVGNRPSSLQTIKGGIKKNGTLTALQMTNYTSGGVGRGDRCSEPLIDLYQCPHVKVREFSVYTNTGAGRPTRAPGFPQGIFALDGFLDELAAEIGMDPLELRRKNYVTKNRGGTGIPYSSKGLDKCYELGAKAIGWERRNPLPGQGNGKILRGLGMASQIWWGTGRPGTAASVKLHRDGSVEAVCGTQDLGTGTRTHMAVVTAESLGLDPQDITVKIGSTEYPWCGSSGGSTTTPSVAPAVREAALKAADFLRSQAARLLKIAPGEVILGHKKFINAKNPEQSVAFEAVLGELRREMVFHGECGSRSPDYAYNTFAAHFAEVEVDTETGQIWVLKVVAVHDSGQIMNKQTAESQVVGGITQGLSTALFEQRVMDDTTGNMVNPNLRDYKIATSMDIPEIVPLFVDMKDPHMNPLGAKGLGEPPRIPPAAAIANAVHNAIGIPIREIPMTPDRVLAALKQKETGR